MKFWFSSSKVKIASYLKKANALYEKRSFAKAAALYRKILQSDPEHFAAKANLATAYFEQEDFARAIPLLQEVIKADSANPWWRNYLAQASQKNGAYHEALDAALKAVELSGGQNEHQLNLAYTIYETADEKGADFIKPCLEKWYREYPENGIVRQCYFAFFSDDSFCCSSPEYVESLFDVFAGDFDEVLSELNYSSPQRVASLTAEFLTGGKSKKKRILDLGCGTGLCGRYLSAAIAGAELTGVDISGRMLREAARKKVYKELLKFDINNCFGKVKEKFDAAVCADVFTYFGRLDEVFKRIAGVLPAEGIFIFTVSKNTQNNKDWFLMPSSRFVHTDSYVGKCLHDAGFSCLQKEEMILRKEGEKDVAGYVFVSRKI